MEAEFDVSTVHLNEERRDDLVEGFFDLNAGLWRPLDDTVFFTQQLAGDHTMNREFEDFA